MSDISPDVATYKMEDISADLAANAADPVVPRGAVIAWYAKTGPVPKGWAICDGSNGTPDLRGRFVRGVANLPEVGRTGGRPSHAHTGIATPDITKSGWSPGKNFESERAHTYNHSHPVITNAEDHQALSTDEEKTLLHACSLSRSRSLLPAVLLALNTGMRYSEIRLLKWKQVDLDARAIRVGKSKTEAGAGRVIPLNAKASEILRFWAEAFPRRDSEHYVFPSERYGAGGDPFEVRVFDTDPETPMTSWKEAWESVKRNTGLSVRFHDLRHTCVTRMLEGGAPLSVVASILGWSPATTVRMAKRYGHIGQVALRQAVEILDVKPKRTGRAAKRGHKIGHTESASGERAPLKH